MPLRFTTLGDVLLHIYDFDLGGAIYFPDVEMYEVDTPCVVASSFTPTEAEGDHQSCMNKGFKNWLNVAVVSDTCDDVTTQTKEAFIAAFNEDCQEGGWLWKMKNWESPKSHSEN
jgi:hypothetical protein